MDPVVVAIFGPPPEGIDLGEEFMPAPGADALVIALACIAGLSVLLRFTARFMQKAGLEADDYLIVFSLAFVIATCIMVVEANAAGAGRHVWAVTLEQVIQATKRILLLGVFSGISLGATKSSILMLYVRIFSLRTRVFRCLVYVGAFLTLGSTLGTVLLMLATCRPVSYFWVRFDPGAVGSCASTGPGFLLVGVVNLFLDFYLLAIPIPQILKLNMSRRRKMVLCGLILMGVFAAAAGIIRNYYLGLFKPLVEADYTWGMQPANIWLCVEATLGIVCACLANVSPLYLWAQSHIRSLVRGGGGGGSSGSGGSRDTTGSEGHRDKERGTLPSYIESRLVLRPQKEDEIRLTTLATIGRDRDSDDGAHPVDGIVVRSEFTQVIIHDTDQR